MKENDYRCSCCNNIVPNASKVYLSWHIKNDKELKYPICKPCFGEIKAFGHKDIYSYLREMERIEKILA